MMEITQEQCVRMERAHVHAWPALSSERIEGWLWRSSGGGSQRANSVSTIDFTGNDLESAIDTVEARYRAVGSVSRFQTFDHGAPPGLTDCLMRRGYRESETTVTMFRSNSPVFGSDRVEQRDHAWPAWNDVYFGAITENRRTINARIIKSVPAPRAFFCYEAISTCLCVLSFGCAVIECVATHSDSRRRGAARAVTNALLTWASGQEADLIGLQVVASNVPAIRLYESLGFVAGATNRFWVRAI